MTSIDPIIWFFVLGIFAGISKSELRLPNQIYDFVSMLLLLTIGLKGGIELAQQSFLVLLPQITTVIIAGLILPLLIFPILKTIGKFSKADSASIAAHYGSVSVGTFAVAVAYMNARNIEFEQHMALFVVLLEVPAILVGIVLAKGIGKALWILSSYFWYCYPALFWLDWRCCGNDTWAHYWWNCDSCYFIC